MTPDFEILQRTGHDAAGAPMQEILDPGVNPLDRADVQALLVDQYALDPTRLDDLARPTVSDSPDELEKWEAAAIQERRRQMPGEPLDVYVARWLYEESFSVNQHPGSGSPELHGSTGYTPGGLVSHHYFLGAFDGQTVAGTVQRIDASVPTFGQALRQLGNMQQEVSLYSVVARTSGEDVPAGLLSGVRKVVAGEDYPEVLDTRGYRLLRMLRTTPAMTDPVADRELIERFAPEGTTDISRAELMVWAWQRSSRAMFNPDGTYRIDNAPERQQALTNLVFLRTHPEMQIFYKYFSPSGYLNEHSRQTE